MAFHSMETQALTDGYGDPGIPGKNGSPYTYRVWQDEARRNMHFSYDAVPRIPRTANDYSFLRQFDVMMGARRFDGSHMSMADHRRIEQPVYGMQTTKSYRNSFRLAPAPMDVYTNAYPSQGMSQNPGQNFAVSPESNYSSQSRQGHWRLG